MMTAEYIKSTVRQQLAIDLNCTADDFDKDGIMFFEAKENPGRRSFPRGERHFEMVTMGYAIIVSATADIMPYLKEQLSDKSRDEAFSTPFVCGHGLYYLPDKLHALPLPSDISFKLFEQPEISDLYNFEGFHNAVQYDINHPRPDVLAIIAMKNDEIIGMAGASADCKMMWQIGIDVLPAYRNLGIASVLTNHLAIEVQNRGKIPYYGTASSNIASQRVAHRAGFQPAWVCAYRGRFDGILTAATG